MPEFLHLLPPQTALQTLSTHLKTEIQSEEVESADALRRVTVRSVVAPHPLPSFPRSTVDGFAVRAAATYGATESLPAYLELIGEVSMGTQPQIRLTNRQCALIHTGGMLPEGADAVVMVEHTQQVRSAEIEVLRSVAVGDNVLQVGEDVLADQEVVPAGTALGPAEIGGLMALGITTITVAKKPRVGILSSGDEVVAPGNPVHPGQVRDVNTYTLKALVAEHGGEPVLYGIIPDQEAEIRAAAQRALQACDVVVLTAGSSVSTRDLTAQVIDALGEPGVLVHGVNVRPGKPTILGVCEGKAVIGLPGNPVSALVIAEIFVVPVLQRLLGVRRTKVRPQVQARLSINLASQSGREDWVAVRLIPQGTRYEADPVYGKSNLIFTLARADGLVRIPADANGLEAGEDVQVYLF